MAANGTVCVDGGAAPGGGVVGSFAPLGRVLQDHHWIPSAQTEEALEKYLLNESRTSRCSGEPERGGRLSVQTCDRELVDRAWLQGLVMLLGSRAEAQRGVGEESAQAGGLAPSMSPDCLDRRVLRFREAGVWRSKCSPTSLGDGVVFPHQGCQFCPGDNGVFADLTPEETCTRACVIWLTPFCVVGDLLSQRACPCYPGINMAGISLNPICNLKPGVTTFQLAASGPAVPGRDQLNPGYPQTQLMITDACCWKPLSFGTSVTRR